MTDKTKNINMISIIQQERRLWTWAYQALRDKTWKSMELVELQRLCELKRRFGEDLPSMPDILASHQDYLAGEFRKSRGWSQAA